MVYVGAITRPPWGKISARVKADDDAPIILWSTGQSGPADCPECHQPVKVIL